MTLAVETITNNETESFEIPHGFKMNELGLIPEDWDLKCLGDVCWVNQGLQIAIEKRLKHKTDSSKTYITIQFLNNGKEAEYVDEYSPSVCCTEEDILMTRTGNTGVVVTGVEGVFHNNFFKINYNKIFINKSYLTYYFKSDKTQKTILCKAGTSTIPDLNHNDFYSILIPLPDLNEQQAIAAALSDIDSLINSLDQLIAKKRNIKLAAMQQLLTGKQRLSGFNGEWRLKKLEDMLNRIANGAVYRPSNSSGMPITRIETISNGYIDFQRIGYAENNSEIEKYKIEFGDILFSHINSLDHIGKVAFFESNELLYHGMNLLLLRANHEVNSRFLYYWLASENGRKHSRTLAKQAVSQASINTSELKTIEINVPELSEQIAIAKVFTDMDTELSTLEQQLAKARNLKQGMMQELLTGRIRLT